MSTNAAPVTLSAAHAALDALRPLIQGDVRDDRLYRALYATDASIYQMMPDAVVLPKTIEDVKAAVRVCAQYRMPITARGAGTGLAGGAVNRGIQLDCSRFLNRIIRLAPDDCLAMVEPGVVLDELNAAARPYGLHFAPDVATGSRATLGGMIANNSCGAHSVMYGRTVDHVLGLHVVLSDGSDAWWGAPSPWPSAVQSTPLSMHCEQVLAEIAREYSSEIESRFPKVMRRNGGYALDRLHIKNGRINSETVICGSEGTLAIVVGAVLRLTPLPRHKGLAVVHFDDLLDALAATPTVLEHSPAAVELLDKLILDAARASVGMSRRIEFLQGDPQGVLIVELYDDDARALTRRLQEVVADLQSKKMGYAWPILANESCQADVWNVRKAGLGLLMSRPGERHPYDFVDDTAVDPARLRDYIARFMQVLKEEGVHDASYYAHASVGCLHVKPVLNLRHIDDVQRMYRIADRISSLVLEFGGAMTGEHGDGLVRSVWLEKMFGPKLIEAFRKVKSAFDPLNVFNPGKIVEPLSMTENLRWRPNQGDPHRGTIQKANAVTPLTVLDFSTHGGMAGLAEMCSGVGQCRSKLVGTMCPSYMATGDELHTTRARANALRLALSDQSLLNGLADPALDEVMDLCLSCKACKTECPTGVDMAKLKAEWLHHRNQCRGVPLRSRFIARFPEICTHLSAVAPVVNFAARSAIGRALADVLFGIDQRVPLPRFARPTFREWFASRETTHAPQASSRSLSVSKGMPQVCLFIDTWTNFFTPEVGIAAIDVLNAFGFDPIVPETVCCGRPAISKGLLFKAKSLAEKNVSALAPFATAGLPIIALEPSCASVLMDELPQLVRTEEARLIAGSSIMIESFLAKHLASCPNARAQFRIPQASNWPLSPDFVEGSKGKPQASLLYHAHCHQKALTGTGDAMDLLRSFADAQEINSGCCGMAGSFGHEKEHYEIARAIGEQRLFPAVRNRGGAQIAVSGFSCRHQIAHHTGIRSRHVVEYLADAIRASGRP